MITLGNQKNPKANLKRKVLSYISLKANKDQEAKFQPKKIIMQIIKNTLKLNVQVFMKATEQILMLMVKFDFFCIDVYIKLK